MSDEKPPKKQKPKKPPAISADNGLLQYALDAAEAETRLTEKLERERQVKKESPELAAKPKRAPRKKQQDGTMAAAVRTHRKTKSVRERPGLALLQARSDEQTASEATMSVTEAKRSRKRIFQMMPPRSPEEAWDTVRRWFERNGWMPWPYQTEAWQAFLAGKDGLIQVPTGAGKTYAALMGPLLDLMINPPETDEGLCLLYITPLRALTRDIESAINRAVVGMSLNLRIESRTGDTTNSQRARQRKGLPHILLTTPESLSLLLSYDDAKERFRNLRAVILDEWHEMLSTKRGIQMELALARLRHWTPVPAVAGSKKTKQPQSTLRTWALSATLANVAEAAQIAAGLNRKPVIVTGNMERPIIIDTLIPDAVDRFPWAGHLGFSMLEKLVNTLDPEFPTLIFTNVRSQAERWFQAILERRPEWAGILALHHGSMDREEREFVELGMKEGLLRLVVCTSSLDLGVDFAPVERVFQIGSPKGLARLIQRAGRAAHRPGAVCRITCVPTQAMELLEVAAARDAIAAGHIEGRYPIRKPYDVLSQHIVTVALGGGVFPQDLFEELRQTVSYQDLTREEYDWVLQLAKFGGKTLSAYPEFHKIERVSPENAPEEYGVPNRIIGQLHRMNIGTILSESSIQVVFIHSKKRLGQMEEGFISRLKPGDVFNFSGRSLEYVSMDDSVAYVRQAKKKAPITPRWMGARMPFSETLGQAIRDELETLSHPDVWDKTFHPKSTTSARSKKTEITFTPAVELLAARPILETQRRLSRLPGRGELLAETLAAREGNALFLYPFEGRFVHEGLAAVLATRLNRRCKTTFELAFNDYGLMFISNDAYDYQSLLDANLFDPQNVAEDLLESLNLSELAKRQFREIARVSGLIYQNHPGKYKTSRQLQSSASLIYDVFRRFDPDNLFLQQARQEVLERQFEESRLTQAMLRLQACTLQWQTLKEPSPFCFPLLVERVGNRFQLTGENLADRVEKMKKQWLK